MLAPTPLDALEAHLGRCAAAQLACDPADRRTAEDGIRLAYAAAGRAAPQRIIWCASPLEIARQLAAATPADAIGANVKAEIFDQVRDRVGTFAEIFWKEVLTAAMEGSNHNSADAAVEDNERSMRVGAAMHRVVLDATNPLLDRLRTRTRHALMQMRGMPRILPRSGFEEVAVGPRDLALLGVYEYLHDVLAWREPTGTMLGLWKIAKSAGWLVPHENVCWISERPDILHADARGRLHCPDGPALRFRDGWSAYAWKGIEVPAWVIEQPERITRATISDTFDPALRNCMIEIMTPERFVESGGATRVARDATGVLWRRFWGYRGVTIGSWVAVEVVNGTAEADGSHKRYFLRVPAHIISAREAVAWTYGLTEDQYARLDLRT